MPATVTASRSFCELFGFGAADAAGTGRTTATTAVAAKHFQRIFPSL
jgi:hypothetical protein